ncbi:MAG TPA: peptidoglycan-binding domain-containing protein [Gemmatimonadaceae bacterium]
MQLSRRTLSYAAIGATMSVFALSSARAQSRLTLPAGSVILVRTQTQLESSTARVGQTFETVVADSIGLDNYTVIPRGSRIRGSITYVQPATRSQSGVIEVSFDRLTLSDGTVYPIRGRLTSTDAEERRQIEQSSDPRVVLVGGRGGIGAAIAGAGSQGSSSNNFLSALGALLSEGRNVSVSAGTTLAVQLEQAVSLRARGTRRGNSDATVFTSADMIRAAQQELARQSYYRGTVDGQLTYATQRAIFEYQVDKGLTGTGNLDWRTVRSLGLTGIVGNGSTGSSGMYLTADQAATLRRDAQTAAARQRQDLSVSSTGRFGSTVYGDADLDLWFALSAFADNASLYEQVIRSSNTNETMTAATRALLNAARRVDTSMSSSRASNSVRNYWSAIRSRLTSLDSTYY